MTRHASSPLLAIVVLVLVTATAGAQALPPDGAEVDATLASGTRVERAVRLDQTSPEPSYWLIYAMLGFAGATAAGFAWVTMRRTAERARESAARSAWSTVDLLVSAQSTASPTPARARRDVPAAAPPDITPITKSRSTTGSSPAFGRRPHSLASVNSAR